MQWVWRWCYDDGLALIPVWGHRVVSVLQRKLVNLEMVKDDIAMLPAGDYASEHHRKLVKQYRAVLSDVSEHLTDITERQFRAIAAQTGIDTVFSRKQMVSVQVKMITNVLAFWDADQKASAILATEFGEQADKRLDLLQVKAVRAKSQLKTVAEAMGQSGYQSFVYVLGLAGTELEWSQLFKR